MKARIAVLASGGGTNLQAILDHLAARGADADGEVVLVASDRPAAGALEHARRAGGGIATAVLRSPSATDGCDALAALRTNRVDFVALAGYLRLLPKEIIAEFPNRIVNVHPALLPAFGGADMYGEQWGSQYVAIARLKPDWNSIVEKNNFSWIFIGARSPLSLLLSEKKDWRLIYADKVAEIFVKDIADNRALIAKYPEVRPVAEGQSKRGFASSHLIDPDKVAR